VASERSETRTREVVKITDDIPTSSNQEGPIQKNSVTEYDRPVDGASTSLRDSPDARRNRLDAVFHNHELSTIQEKAVPL
jgi:hypothetical protein